MENELIKVTTNEEGKQLVSARELYQGLGLSKRFSAWIEQYINKDNEYLFEEGKDFTSVLSSTVVNNGAKREIQDYAITISMAKEICMVTKNDKGKEYRKYFIECEKKLKELATPSYMITEPIERAKAWIKEEEQRQLLESKNKELKLENNQQKQVIGELKPKADYTDIILRSKGLVTVTQIAKDYGLSARALNSKLHELGIQYKQSGQWLLYSKYHDSGFTKSETYSITRKDGETEARLNTKWTQKGRLFLYDMLKDNGILPTIEK